MNLKIETFSKANGRYFGRVERQDGFVYVTDACESDGKARSSAEEWCNWHENVISNDADTIYYIVAIPYAWIGPYSSANRYSGLEVKIGRSRNLMKRFSNLRTGTGSHLVIHAIEPGNSTVEQQRHNEFAKERRQGEWFVITPRLEKHIMKTWFRNNLLPREHQLEIVDLQHRIDKYIYVKKVIGVPDMVNPSLEEPWHGNVFVDLEHAMPWGVSRQSALRKYGPLKWPFDEEK